MPNSIDTLWDLLVRFVSMIWNMYSVSMFVALLDLPWFWASYNLSKISWIILLLQSCSVISGSCKYTCYPVGRQGPQSCSVWHWKFDFRLKTNWEIFSFDLFSYFTIWWKGTMGANARILEIPLIFFY